MRNVSRYLGTLLVVLCLSRLALAQTNAGTEVSTGWSSPYSDFLGVEAACGLRSTRANVLGPLYYQRGNYSLSGRFLGESFSIMSGTMEVSDWQALGVVPIGSARSVINLPFVGSWTPFESELTIHGTTSFSFLPLIPIWSMHGSYSWWVFTIDLSGNAWLTADSYVENVRMGMNNNVLSGIAGSMRQGLGVSVALGAGFELNLLIGGAGIRLDAYVTLMAGGLQMPFYLDPSQVTSDLKLSFYQAAQVDITGYVWFLFSEESYTWHFLPYTSWDLGTFDLLSIRR